MVISDAFMFPSLFQRSNLCVNPAKQRRGDVSNLGACKKRRWEVLVFFKAPFSILATIHILGNTPTLTIALTD